MATSHWISSIELAIRVARRLRMVRALYAAQLRDRFDPSDDLVNELDALAIELDSHAEALEDEAPLMVLPAVPVRKSLPPAVTVRGARPVAEPTPFRRPE